MCESAFLLVVADGTKIRVDDLAQAMDGFVISYGFMGWNKFARELVEEHGDLIRKMFTEGVFLARCPSTAAMYISGHWGSIGTIFQM